MVGGKAGTFWEGGKGCRNKAKMNRLVQWNGGGGSGMNYWIMEVEIVDWNRVGRHGQQKCVGNAEEERWLCVAASQQSTAFFTAPPTCSP